MPVILWMGIIFAASTDLGSAEHTSRFLIPLLHWFHPAISATAIATIQFLIRKAAHLTEYAVLGVLLLRAFRTSVQGSFAVQAAIVLAVAAVYAGSDEFHQSFIPSRTPSVRDVMIDCCGAVVGLGLYWMVRRLGAPLKQVRSVA